MVSLLKKLFLIITCVATCTVTIAYAGNSFQDTCENQIFKNTYYSIENKDIDAASDFFRQISMKESLREEARLTVKIGERNRNITYYDFDKLELLNANKELMYIIDENLLDYRPEKKQIIFNDRTVSYGGEKTFGVKYYNKKLTSFDKHPLFSLIKRKERPLLIDLLSSVSTNDPNLIRESLKLKSVENVFLITHFGIPTGAITLNLFSLIDFSMPNTWFSLKFEVFANEDSVLTLKEKNILNMFFCRTDKQFRTQFPYAKMYSKFGYVEYHKLAAMTLPSRVIFRKHPLLFSIGQIMCLGFIGFLFIYLVLGRYSKQDTFRKVYRYKPKNII